MMNVLKNVLQKKKYFVNSDINPTKNCLIDCPEDYPYYTIIKDANGKNVYACSEECQDYYVPSVDTNKNAKLCLSTCPDTNYPNIKYKLEYVVDDRPIKECYETCPEKAVYHFDLDSSPSITDNNCYKKCPDSAPYHEKGGKI